MKIELTSKLLIFIILSVVGYLYYCDYKLINNYSIGIANVYETHTTKSGGELDYKFKLVNDSIEGYRYIGGSYSNFHK